MLVLARKRSERIQIGQNIFITIVDISPHVVKIGIDAPANIPVHREEIAQKIAQNEPNTN